MCRCCSRLRRLGYHHPVRVCDSCWLDRAAAAGSDDADLRAQLLEAQRRVAEQQGIIDSLTAQLQQATTSASHLRGQLRAEQDRIHALMNARDRERETASAE